MNVFSCYLYPLKCKEVFWTFSDKRIGDILEEKPSCCTRTSPPGVPRTLLILIRVCGDEADRDWSESVPPVNLLPLPPFRSPLSPFVPLCPPLPLDLYPTRKQDIWLRRPAFVVAHSTNKISSRQQIPPFTVWKLATQKDYHAKDIYSTEVATIQVPVQGTNSLSTRARDFGGLTFSHSWASIAVQYNFLLVKLSEILVLLPAICTFFCEFVVNNNFFFKCKLYFINLTR